MKMILFFHFICLLARYIVSNISKSLGGRKLNWDGEVTDSYSHLFSDSLKDKAGHVKYPVYEDNTLRFFPPVYVQRYETVTLILEEAIQKYDIKKVVDFGCAELGFLVYLKNLGVTEILEVDIDSELLKRHAHKAAPLTSDYLMGKWKRPLDVYVLAGNIAEYDDHLIGCDALVAIELIEHLAEEDFERMPYNVFYKIKPRIVIFTTPNADFNCLFPNFADLRHKDHQFEWTRKEFYDWTQLVLSLYPEYSVKFFGIGAGPEGTENLGCCTQMAVFTRSDDSEYFQSAKEETKGVQNYELIQHYKYPLFIDSRTTEEKIVHEIQYQASYLSTLDGFYDYETNESKIPLNVLKEFVSDLCSDEEELKIILKRNGVKLRQIGNSWCVVCSEVEPNPSDITSRCDDDDDWLNEEISETFYDNDLFLAEKWSDDEQPGSENIPHFQSDGNLKQFKSNFVDNSFFLEGEESIAACKEKILPAPKSCNQLVKQLDTSKLPLNGGKNEKLVLTKSRIPCKKSERYDDSFGKSEGDNSLAFIYKPFKKISKSCSLDSCLENINSRLSENESYYLNLTPGGSSSSNMGGSLSPRKRKNMKHCSGSSLLSSSLDRAGDSGYPFSYSPPEDNLTPEQVDELFTDNEMSRSTSTSSEVDAVDIVNHVFHHDVFIEDVQVENGDLANNNRDGEGNNVEGLMGQRLVNEVAAERDPNDNLFFVEPEEFPLWLLNLGELALRPVYFPLHDSDYDEGVGDDSSGRFSPEIDDIDF